MKKYLFILVLVSIYSCSSNRIGVIERGGYEHSFVHSNISKIQKKKMSWKDSFIVSNSSQNDNVFSLKNFTDGQFHLGSAKEVALSKPFKISTLKNITQLKFKEKVKQLPSNTKEKPDAIISKYSDYRSELLAIFLAVFGLIFGITVPMISNNLVWIFRTEAILMIIWILQTAFFDWTLSDLQWLSDTMLVLGSIGLYVFWFALLLGV